MSQPPEPGMISRYQDCGTSVIKESTDAAFGPLQPGCFEITEAQYLIRVAEIRGETAALKAAIVAEANQAEDDRISDIVAVKVAEVLAARDAATDA